MPIKSRPTSLKSESDMSQAVARILGKYAVREVWVGDCIFDVVAYNKKKKSFRLVECKMSKSVTGIGKAFGQLAAYSATIATRADEFLDAYSKRLRVPMRLGEWMEATDNYRRFNIDFCVALTHKACRERLDWLRAMKKVLPDVGIIRVKPNGSCSYHIWHGKIKDAEVTKASTIAVKIVR
jgi:hypothetical protein